MPKTSTIGKKTRKAKLKAKLRYITNIRKIEISSAKSRSRERAKAAKKSAR